MFNFNLRMIGVPYPLSFRLFFVQSNRASFTVFYPPYLSPRVDIRDLVFRPTSDQVEDKSRSLGRWSSGPVRLQRRVWEVVALVKRQPTSLTTYKTVLELRVVQTFEVKGKFTLEGRLE